LVCCLLESQSELKMQSASAAICEIVTSFSDAADAASWQGFGMGDSDKLLACETVKHVTTYLRSPHFRTRDFFGHGAGQWNHSGGRTCSVQHVPQSSLWRPSYEATSLTVTGHHHRLHCLLFPSKGPRTKFSFC
jgi:hypothetical protein